MKKYNKFIGVDIFSGAGGMSMGASMAGINVKIAIENNKHAAETFALNHPNSKVIVEDISKISSNEIINDVPFILFGGPPCQGFSNSNTRTKNVENPNNLLFEQYLRFVKELNPEWVVFENVEGFKYFEKGFLVDELERRLDYLGYSTKSSILWASDYGVPQNRNRFFLVANRKNIEFEFPQIHFKKISVYEAIYDLPTLVNGDSFDELPYKTKILNSYTRIMRKNSEKSFQNYVSKNKEYVIERYKHIGQGQNWSAIPSQLMGNYKTIQNTHSGIYKRLVADKPSVVIANYRKNMLIHPFENRGLSVREAARLQSFPDNFLFKGSLMHIQQQIGNAVPPLLAKAIFEQIIKLSNKN
ncbi:DNA cytosine methyltransferase [Runella salmonicolor]|uniref:DNA (cytosine-5-)-methyltransferase n=1 Tax=Runella salmonicolor TaxID=2950278 RepID=A0ABT1FSR7_9BACT|nr:DNA cytosine methyltransferase [Runella salmonicolor]MCP1384811.1 DNA cytosine methyltransferase [Runella salmonicolor]